MAHDDEDLSDEEMLKTLENLYKKGVIEPTALGFRVKPEIEAAFNHEGSNPKDRN